MLRPAGLSAAVLILLCLPAAAAAGQGEKEARPRTASPDTGAEPSTAAGEEELKALDRRWWERGKAYLAAIKEEQSPEKRAELAVRLLPAFDARAVEAFFQLEKRYRGRNPGLFALWHVMMRAGGLGDPDAAVTRGRERALGILREHYLKHEDLDFLFEALNGGPLVMGAEPLLEAAAEKSPHEHVRAAALFHLADQLRRQAELKTILEDRLRRTPPAESPVDRTYREWDRKTLQRLAGVDGAEARKRAARLARRVQAEYPDAVAPLRAIAPGVDPIPRRSAAPPGRPARAKVPTYAERAEGLLVELTQLIEGQPAPALVGRDADGKEFRLSDCHGKVVVVMFSANWCGPCKGFYPVLREVQTKFAGKPVVVVTVMADDELKTVRQAIARGEITWRAVWDGRNGPIATKWNVQSYPTLYVCDQRGVIRRARDAGDGPDLMSCIDELLGENRGRDEN